MTLAEMVYRHLEYSSVSILAEARGDPVELTAFWYGLPANVDKVDAVYERQDHKIVFFAGKYFYVLAGNSQLEQGPTPLSYLGLPDDLDHIDAAMTWGYNGKTFFFSGEYVGNFDWVEVVCKGNYSNLYL